MFNEEINNVRCKIDSFRYHDKCPIPWNSRCRRRRVEKDETAAIGFTKGVGYGAAESLVLTSMFGIKYDMFGTIHEKTLEKQFDQEIAISSPC